MAGPGSPMLVTPRDGLTVVPSLFVGDGAGSLMFGGGGHAEMAAGDDGSMGDGLMGVSMCWVTWEAVWSPRAE